MAVIRIVDAMPHCYTYIPRSKSYHYDPGPRSSTLKPELPLWPSVRFFYSTLL